MGSSMLVLAIASFLAFFRREWGEIRIYFEIMIMQGIGSILMDIAIVPINIGYSVDLSETQLFRLKFLKKLSITHKVIKFQKNLKKS